MGRQAQVHASLPKGTISAGPQRCSLSESRSRTSFRSRTGAPTRRGSPCPTNGTSPHPVENVWAARIGGRRGRSRRNPDRRSRFVMVEGTLVSRMACSFAGSRRSGGLGRSVSFVVGLLPHGRSRRRQRGVSWAPRRGTSSAYANQGVRTRAGRHRPSRARGRVLRSVQEPAHRHGRSRPSRSCGNAGSRRRGQLETP